MKIHVNDHVGHPFQVQLSRALAQRGHEVLHTYTAELQTPRGFLAKRNGDPSNLAICGIPLSRPFDRYGLTRRFEQERELGKRLELKAREFRPKVIVSANTPLVAQQALLSTSRQLGTLFIFWLQDLLGVGIKNNLKKKLPVLGGVIGRYFMHLEKTLLARSDAAVAITEDFVPILIRARMPREKIHVIHNWAPLDEIPRHDKANPWSRKHGLGDKFCFLYSGTLGMKHNPALLVELASRFQAFPNVRVVVISEGLGADFLHVRKERFHLENLLILPFQPFEEFPMVLAAADVLVAILEPDAGVFSVPSKVLTYLCTRRPLLLAIPPENLAARTVESAGAGIVIPPTDTGAFLDAAETLANDSGLREDLAANGLSYALNTFDIERITSRFEEIFQY
jgi:glycosyltransferase involved in cell wall biosynthesis